MSGGHRIRSLPISTRLTLAFVVAMVLTVGAASLAVYELQARSVAQSVDRDLRQRWDDIVATPTRDRTALVDNDEALTQVYDPSGTVIASTHSLANSHLLPRRIIARSLHSTVLTTLKEPGSTTRSLRVYARYDRGRGVVVAVATLLRPRVETLESLIVQLLVGGGLVIVLGTLGAYLLARRALRPVDRMRRQAAVMSIDHANRQLEVPPGGDELSRLATTLNDLLERLHDSVAHERTFVADAGHELRTPLALLSNEIELALERPRSVEEYQQTLQSLQEETTRLAALAEQLLDLSTAGDGAKAKVAPFDLAALSGRVARRRGPLLEEQGRTIVVEVEPGCTARGDEHRVEQAVSNLVDNAVRHGAGTVTLRCSHGDHRVELHVLDEGPGFDDRFLASAFERFSREESSRTGPGTGLGLAIVHSIAVAHDGDAGARNRERGGADVWIVLPA